MTSQEILALWAEVSAGLEPHAVRVMTPLEALSWSQRAANGQRTEIALVLAVARYAPAPATLEDLLALAICKAVAEAFGPEQDDTPEAAASRSWGVKVTQDNRP